MKTPTAIECRGILDAPGVSSHLAPGPDTPGGGHLRWDLDDLRAQIRQLQQTSDDQGEG